MNDDDRFIKKRSSFTLMTLAGVSGLFDERAKVEIEAVAMLP